MKNLAILLVLATIIVSSCITNNKQHPASKPNNLTIFLKNGERLVGTGEVNLRLNTVICFDSMGNKNIFTPAEVDSASLTNMTFTVINNRFFKHIYKGKHLSIFERKYDEIVGNNTTITHKKEHTILAFEHGYDRKLELKENVINFYEYQKLFRFTRRCVERSDNIHFEDIIDLLKQYDKCSKKINNRTIPRNTLEIIADIDTMAKK